MDQAVLLLILSTSRMVVDMAANWNNPEYVPPSPEDLEALATQVEALPDLPTKKD